MNFAKNKITLVLIAVALILSSVTFSAKATELRTNILQYKQGRFYFPAGREVLVYPHCTFSIFNGDDSLLSGRIKVSALGVSYSDPVETVLDSAMLDKLTAVITTADIDSTAAITIGTVYFNQVPYSSMFPDLFGLFGSSDRSEVFFTESGNAIKIKRYLSPAEMKLAFESGAIDGYFSYNYPQSCDTGLMISSAQAPYFVALLPNISTLYNQRGLMTSSLYYRVDDGNLGNLFGGDRAVAQNCPEAMPDSCPRPLPYDLLKGQQLLNVLKPINGPVRIASSEREFQPTAMYFADVLWREKVETRIQVGQTGADIYIAPVPVAADSLWLSLEYIKTFLSRDTIAGRSANKNLQLLNNYINEIKAADSTDRQLEYAKKSAELLWQDIGVFSLYRPRVYFISRQDIGNAVFDKDGYMNLRELVKLRLPNGD